MKNAFKKFAADDRGDITVVASVIGLVCVIALMVIFIVSSLAGH
jgi:hypothetical protein